MTREWTGSDKEKLATLDLLVTAQGILIEQMSAFVESAMRRVYALQDVLEERGTLTRAAVERAAKRFSGKGDKGRELVIIPRLGAILPRLSHRGPGAVAGRHRAGHHGQEPQRAAAGAAGGLAVALRARRARRTAPGPADPRALVGPAPRWPAARRPFDLLPRAPRGRAGHRPAGGAPHPPPQLRVAPAGRTGRPSS